jgi:hypothetical protein
MLENGEMGLTSWVYVLTELKKIQYPSKKVRATVALVEGFILELTQSYEIEDVEKD